MEVFKQVLDRLNRTEARYVLVGGFAAVLHGLNRFTTDVDLILDLEPRATEKVVLALQDLGFKPNVPIDPIDLGNPDKRQEWIEKKNAVVISFRHQDHPAFAIDIFLKSPIDFNVLFKDSKFMPLGSISARVCSIEHLIELKQIAARPQDLLDIEALRKIQSVKVKI
jgi:hypothetical protein